MSKLSESLEFITEPSNRREYNLPIVDDLDLLLDPTPPIQTIDCLSIDVVQYPESYTREGE